MGAQTRAVVPFPGDFKLESGGTDLNLKYSIRTNRAIATSTTLGNAIHNDSWFPTLLVSPALTLHLGEFHFTLPVSFGVTRYYSSYSAVIDAGGEPGGKDGKGAEKPLGFAGRDQQIEIDLEGRLNHKIGEIDSVRGDTVFASIRTSVFRWSNDRIEEMVPIGSIKDVLDHKDEERKFMTQFLLVSILLPLAAILPILLLY